MSEQSETRSFAYDLFENIGWIILLIVVVLLFLWTDDNHNGFFD